MKGPKYCKAVPVRSCVCPELAWSPHPPEGKAMAKQSDLTTVSDCMSTAVCTSTVHMWLVGENRPVGNLGTYSRDGDGDNLLPGHHHNGKLPNELSQQHAPLDLASQMSKDLLIGVHPAHATQCRRTPPLPKGTANGRLRKSDDSSPCDGWMSV